MFFKSLKKIAVVLLTKNPYQVKRFKDLYKSTVGEKIDLPECSTYGVDISAGTTVHYPEPIILNPHEKMDRYVGKSGRFAQRGLFKTPNQRMYSLQNGCIIGQLGLVYDIKHRSFIDESSKEWVTNLKKMPYTNAFTLPEKIHLNGITLSFLSLGADGGFYHFLFESLSRAEIFQPTLAIADHFLFNGPATAWKLKWINQAGIDTSKIIWVSGTAHYQCEQLLFTNKPIVDQQLNNWCVNALKNTFKINKTTEKTVANQKKIIWITRKNEGTRSLSWEEEVFKKFSNIECVDLTTLDAHETIYQLETATHIIAPHGAGLSNIYLSKPNTKVLELFEKDTFFQPCYYRLSHICGLDHKILFLNFKDKNDVNFGLNLITDTLETFIC